MNLQDKIDQIKQKFKTAQDEIDLADIAMDSGLKLCDALEFCLELIDYVDEEFEYEGKQVRGWAKNVKKQLHEILGDGKE